MNIDSVAAFKRALRETQTISVQNYLHPHLSGSRRLVKVQTNAIAMSIPGHTEKSWLYFPSATDFRFEGTNRVHIDSGGKPFLTITFDSPEVLA